jgi:hypothetical protein
MLRYILSKLIPVPMHSTYGVGDDATARLQHSDWWQWRGRVYRHRVTPVAA